MATFGSDSLYGNKENTKLGTFEQRMEVFTPPYLHKAAEGSARRSARVPRR